MKAKELNLRKQVNENCTKSCNKDKRKINTEEDVCKVTHSVIDNLPVRCVGSWAYDKIYYVSRYFATFAISMQNKWDNTNYLEICSGPGRCINREAGEELDGTSLAIINSNAFPLVKHAAFVDRNPAVVDVLNTRIKMLGKNECAKSIVGDYTDLSSIKNIVNQYPKGCLNLAFIDPTDCSVPFETIRIIKETLKNVDLIINIAYGTDFKRNVLKAVTNHNYNVAKKYKSFLGNGAFFSLEDTKKYADSENNSKLNELFLTEYKKSLKSIGYNYFDLITCKHYYALLYATAHPKGLEFWKKIKTIQANGQRTLPF